MGGGMKAEALRLLDLPPFPHRAAASPHLLMLKSSNSSPFVVMSMFQALHKVLLGHHLI